MAFQRRRTLEEARCIPVEPPLYGEIAGLNQPYTYCKALPSYPGGASFTASSNPGGASSYPGGGSAIFVRSRIPQTKTILLCTYAANNYEARLYLFTVWTVRWGSEENDGYGVCSERVI